MPNLEDFRGFFKQTERERRILYDKQRTIVRNEDVHVAEYLGTSDIQLIAVVRGVIERFKWAESKEVRKQNLTEEERKLLGQDTDIEMRLNTCIRGKDDPVMMDFCYIKPNKGNILTTADSNNSGSTSALKQENPRKRNLEEQDNNNGEENNPEEVKETLLENEAGTIDYGL